MATVNYISFKFILVFISVSQETESEKKFKFIPHFLDNNNNNNNAKPKLKTRGFERNPIVVTNEGPVQGIVKYTVDGKVPYYSFNGIPYAEPPIGELRFQPPVPAKKRQHVFKVDKDGQSCPQGFPKVRGSEDCLNLNVYTPKLPSENFSSPKLPVLIWIYGGTFLTGSANSTLQGPDFFIDQDVIVTMMNYRLGIFGFISTGDLIAPGNNGLRDQHLAIRWIKNNIENFGGDPEQITIWGQSAGAASVSYQLQYPKSKGLFKRAIMDSGTSISALSRHARLVAFRTGLFLGVKTNNSKVLLNRLRDVDFRLLQFKSIEVLSLTYISIDPLGGLLYAPVREPDHPDAFFTGNSYDLLGRGQFVNVPCIIGYNALEGANPAIAITQLYTIGYNFNYSRLVPVDMNIKSAKSLHFVGKIIKREYWGDGLIGVDSNILMQFEIYLLIMSWIFCFSSSVIIDFLRGIYQTVFLQSKFNKIYTYDFAYAGQLSSINHPQNPEWVAHSDELSYLWNANLNSTKSDRLVRKRMVTLWANFVKYGNPTPKLDPLFDNLTWVPNENLKDTNLQALKITTELEMIRSPDYQKRTFWDELYRQYGNPPYDTY